jgi:antitoxin VapB
MALTIEHPAVEELARELAKRTGESVDDAVATAIRERLEREREIAAMDTGDRVRDPVVEEIVARMRRQPLPDPERVSAAIREIQESLAKLPVLDSRTPDEILGYDEFGLPH